MEANKVAQVQETEPTVVELTAKDFCFFLQQDDVDGDTYAYFCPTKFFHDSGSMSKEIYDVLDEIVPEDMDEVQDNCYATARTTEEVREQLLKLGFVQDEEFSKFMETIDEEEEIEAALTGS